MRSLWIGIGLAGLFAAGCSSSTTEDGGTTTSSTGGTTGQVTTSSSTGGTTTTTTTTTTGSSTTGATTTGGTSTGGTTTAGTTTGGTTTGGTTGLADGAACTDNTQCQSQVCGIAGSGNCCSAACSTSDATCGATACDNTGACTYPAGGSACGTDACSGNTLTTNACDGTGTCAAQTPAACPGNLNCADAMTCLASCSAPTDCATGFVCSGGNCITPLVDGSACTDNAACNSGVCGINGSGNCCTAACNTADATCGASACDTTGACTYPPAMTTCGVTCTSSTLTSGACDGSGTCVAGMGQACPNNFACQDATSCATTCADSTSCTSGGFCDTTNKACCTGLATGGTINVDGATGSDGACCGVGGNAACATLTQAMLLIDSAQAQNVTINATVNGGGGDWAPTAETYPIALGWGAELSAPGVFFLDPNTSPNGPPNAAIIDINNANFPNDTLHYASIVGTAANNVGVGMDSSNNQTDDSSSVAVEAGNTLYLANATVNGSWSNIDSQAAIGLMGQASLVLGQDQSAGVTGTVQIGNALGVQATDGWDGLVCFPDFANSLGCTVTDATLSGNSVIIQGQEDIDIWAQDYSNITLTSNPVIGVPPSMTGFGNCPSKPDGQNINADAAILIVGASTVSIKNATVQCIGGVAFSLQADNNLIPAVGPTVTIDSTVIQNSDLAIYASGGTATVTNSTINFNFIGVLQATDFNANTGTIDLTGGGNTVVCSSNVESSVMSSNPGIDVYNTSTASLAADNVAWDTSGPDYISCDNAFTTCTCNITTCSATPPFNGMDAVEDSTNLGGITTTNNTTSSISCN